MKVKTLVKFKDLQENKVREIGEEFEVSEERLQTILEVGKFVEEVEEIEEVVEEAVDEVKEEAPKKKKK